MSVRVKADLPPTRGYTSARSTKLKSLDRFVEIEKFKEAIADNPRDYKLVGPLHDDVLDFGLHPKQLEKTFSGLSQLLRHFQAAQCPEFLMQIGRHKTRIKQVGEGGFGKVYQLTYTKTSGEPVSLAFKVFHQKEQPLTGVITDELVGGYAEHRNELVLTHYTARDKSRFYAGSPLQGWMLSEWIDKEVVKKPDLVNPLSEVLEQIGCEPFDWKDQNKVEGIMVDPGCMAPKGAYEQFAKLGKNVLSKPAFKALALDKQKAMISGLLQNPTQWRLVTQEWKYQSDPNSPFDQKEKFWSSELIQYTQQQILKAATDYLKNPQSLNVVVLSAGLLWCLPEKQKTALLLKALSNPKAKQGFIKEMDEKPYMRMFFWQFFEQNDQFNQPQCHRFMGAFQTHPHAWLNWYRSFSQYVAWTGDRQQHYKKLAERADGNQAFWLKQASDLELLYPLLTKQLQECYHQGKRFVHEMPLTEQLKFYGCSTQLPDAYLKQQAQSRLSSLALKLFRSSKIEHCQWQGFTHTRA